MIKKTIHYCWFGRGQKPELAIRCIESWKKYCPDYEIIEWNEDNFDINSNLYVKQAYENKKYAFVTDYVRLFVLYNYGGIYMDTDVEVLKPLDLFLKHRAFSSFESNKLIPTGIMASEKGNKWIKDLLDEYKNIKFIDDNGNFDLKPNTNRITELSLKKYGLVLNNSYQELDDGAVTIYPYDYFCPKSVETYQINLTENSYTIHHFSGSWLNSIEKNKIEMLNKIMTDNVKKYGIDKGTRKGKIKFRLKFYSSHPVYFLKKINQKIFKKKEIK